ncbi:MAG: hypothetical protein RLZ81_828 [Pseudomonadota bacterium]|jgi:cytochrome c5
MALTRADVTLTAPRDTRPKAALRRRITLCAALLGATLLLACEPRATATASSAPDKLEHLRPADTRLSEKYERACMTCHIDPASGAPRTHDRAAWSQRASLGREALVTSVQQGRNAMPPMGLCPDCSRDDLGALIDFMRGVAP